MKQVISLTVNGDFHEVLAKPNETLAEVLRDRIGLTGTKEGCDTGKCGACTVLIDGEPARSCLILAVAVRNRKITTVEGLAKENKLHPLQEAFVNHNALQCGFCTPGFIMTAKAFLDDNPNPTENEIREAISGNICRCTGYDTIIDAIGAAARDKADGKPWW